MTDLAEAHRYITPPIDEEVERVATAFLESGGGFLTRQRRPREESDRLLDSPPPAPAATPIAASEDSDEAAAAPLPDPSVSTSKPGLLRRIFSRSGRRPESTVAVGGQQ